MVEAGPHRKIVTRKSLKGKGIFQMVTRHDIIPRDLDGPP
jgi:hypothetical protein